MSEKPNWDLPHRKEAWRIIWDAGQHLKIPLSPTISTAMFYLHHYYEVSGHLDLPLFQVALLCTFISAKTEETFCKADDVIIAFVTTASSRPSESLQILGTNEEELLQLRDPNSDEFENFRKNLLDSELDLMTAMNWMFPNRNPFFVLSKWLVTFEKYPRLFQELSPIAINTLCIHYMFIDSLHADIKDLAASALEFAWRMLNVQSIMPELSHWSKYTEYDMNREGFGALLERLTAWNKKE